MFQVLEYENIILLVLFMNILVLGLFVVKTDVLAEWLMKSCWDMDCGDFRSTEMQLDPFVYSCTRGPGLT